MYHNIVTLSTIIPSTNTFLSCSKYYNFTIPILTLLLLDSLPKLISTKVRQHCLFLNRLSKGNSSKFQILLKTDTTKKIIHILLAKLNNRTKKQTTRT
jgi:hypothetical protein